LFFKKKTLFFKDNFDQTVYQELTAIAMFMDRSPRASLNSATDPTAGNK